MYFKHAQNILLNATRHGQVESFELIGKYINRLRFSNGSLPDILYPWIGGQGARKSVWVDPMIRFGQPSITGTGIAVSIILERFEGGESLKYIADGYGIALACVEDAITYATH
ncbi:MAG: DUF433 domain-containing protein [Bacteroidetes bacterium]|nr:DUF433 domain-containing protein [Bacteroidota bacterium]